MARLAQEKPQKICNKADNHLKQSSNPHKVDMVRHLLLLIRRRTQVRICNKSRHQTPGQIVLLLHQQERHMDTLLKMWGFAWKCALLVKE